METPEKPAPATPGAASPRTAKTSAESKLTRQQRDQLINAAADGMAPAHVQKEPEDPLKSWWPQVKRKLKEGYSVRQVHEMLCSPKIGLDVSFRALQRFIAEHKEAEANGLKSA